jgi:hypothetical protein
MAWWNSPLQLQSITVHHKNRMPQAGQKASGLICIALFVLFY